MIKIYDLNWNEIKLSDYGLKCLSFIPESLSPEFFDESSDYIDGSNIVGTKINQRILHTRFLINAVSHLDYQLLRDEIYNILNPRKEMYIVDTRQLGKRWKARTSTSFRPDYINPSVGKFDLEFISQPFAESIGTSLDTFDFTSGLWQVGQGLISEDVQYIHNTTAFSIYNAGTETVDPRKFPLIIKYKGASTNLQIKNNSTLETWTYTGTTTTSDTLELNRLRSLKNTVVNVFGNSNRKSISIIPGMNNFILTGTSGSFEISFDFRFYYA